MHKDITHKRIASLNFGLQMHTLLAIHCYSLTVKLHNYLLRSTTVTAALSVQCGLETLQWCEQRVQTTFPHLVSWSR